MCEVVGCAIEMASMCPIVGRHRKVEGNRRSLASSVCIVITSRQWTKQVFRSVYFVRYIRSDSVDLWCSQSTPDCLFIKTRLMCVVSILKDKCQWTQAFSGICLLLKWMGAIYACNSVFERFSWAIKTCRRRWPWQSSISIVSQIANRLQDENFEDANSLSIYLWICSVILSSFAASLSGRSRRCYLISVLHKDKCQPTDSRTQRPQPQTAHHIWTQSSTTLRFWKCVFINLYCVFTVCLRSLNCANGINLLCDKVSSAETGVRALLSLFFILFIACLRTIPNENDKHGQ